MNKKLYQIKVNGENVDKYVDPKKEKSFLQKYPQAKFLSEFYHKMSKTIKTNYKEFFNSETNEIEGEDILPEIGPEIPLIDKSDYLKRPYGRPAGSSRGGGDEIPKIPEIQQPNELLKTPSETINWMGINDEEEVVENENEYDISIYEEVGGDYDKFLNTELNRVYTIGNAGDWFDHKVKNNIKLHDHPAFNEKIFKGIYDGTHGYNPLTKELFKLSDEIEVPDSKKKEIENLLNAPDLPDEIEISYEGYVDEQGNEVKTKKEAYNLDLITKTIPWDDATEDQQLEWLKNNDPQNYQIHNKAKIDFNYGKNNWDNLSYDYKLNFLKTHNDKIKLDVYGSWNYENPDGPQNRKEIEKNRDFWVEKLNLEFFADFPDEKDFNTGLITEFLEKNPNPNIIEQDAPVVTPSQITSTHITLLPNYEDILKKSDKLKKENNIDPTDFKDFDASRWFANSNYSHTFTNSIPNIVLTYENASEWFDYNSERLLIEDWDARKKIEQHEPIDIDFVKPIHFAKYNYDDDLIRERNWTIYGRVLSGLAGYNPAKDELFMLEQPIEVPVEQAVFSWQNPAFHKRWNEYLKFKETALPRVQASWFENKEQNFLEILQDNYLGHGFEFFQAGGYEIGQDISERPEVGSGWFGTGFSPGADQVQVMSILKYRENLEKGMNDKDAKWNASIIVQCDYESIEFYENAINAKNISPQLAEKYKNDLKELKLEISRLEKFLKLEGDPEGGVTEAHKLEAFLKFSSATPNQITEGLKNVKDAKFYVDRLKEIWGVEHKSDAYVMDLFYQVFTQADRRYLLGAGIKGGPMDPSVTTGYYKDIYKNINVNNFTARGQFKQISKEEAQELWDLLENSTGETYQKTDYGVHVATPEYRATAIDFIESLSEYGDEIIWYTTAQNQFINSYAIDYYIENVMTDPEYDGPDYIDPRSKEAVKEIMSTKEFAQIINGDPNIEAFSGAWGKIKNNPKVFKQLNETVDAYVLKAIELKALQENLPERIADLDSYIWSESDMKKLLERQADFKLENVKQEIQTLNAEVATLKSNILNTIDEVGHVNGELEVLIDKHMQEIGNIAQKYNMPYGTTFDVLMQNEEAMQYMKEKIPDLYTKIADRTALLGVTYTAQLELYSEKLERLLELTESEEEYVLMANFLGMNYSPGVYNVTRFTNMVVDIIQAVLLGTADFLLNTAFIFVPGGKEGARKRVGNDPFGAAISLIIGASDLMQEGNALIDSWQADIDNSLGYGLTLGTWGEAFDEGNLGSKVITVFSEQSAIYGGMLLGGKKFLKVMGLFTGGTKFTELSMQNRMYHDNYFKIKYSEKLQLDPQNFNNWAMTINSFGTGLSTYYLQSFTYATQIKPLQNLLKNNKGQRLLSNNLVKNSLGSPIRFAATESYVVFGETFTEISEELISNMFDWSMGRKRNGILIQPGDNLKEAGIDASVMSALMRIPGYGVSLATRFQSKDENQRLAEIAQKLMDLTNSLPDNLKKFSEMSPTIILTNKDGNIVEKETFAPIEGAETQLDVDVKEADPREAPKYTINGREVGRSEMIDFILNDLKNNDGEIKIENDRQLATLSEEVVKIDGYGETLLEIMDLIKQSDVILSKTVARMDVLTTKEKQTLLELSRLNFEARKKADEIWNSDKTKEQKETEINKLRNEFDARDIQIDNIINNYSDEQIQQKYESFLERMKPIFERLAKMGAPELKFRFLNNTKFNKKQLEFEAGKYDGGVLELEEQVSIVEALKQTLTEIIENPKSTKKQIENAQKELETLDQGADAWVGFVGGILNDKMSKYGTFQPVIKDGKVVAVNIFINSTAAITDGKLNTEVHEFLHFVFYQTLKADPNKRHLLGDKLLDVILSGDIEFKSNAKKRIFWKRVLSYGKKNLNGEEILAVLSEMMMDGDVKFNRNWGQKITDVFRRYAQNNWGVDIAFDSATDIENFIIDYNYSIKSGNMTDAMANMIVKGADGKIFEDNTSYEDRKGMQEHSNIVDKNLQSNPDLKDEFDNLVKNEDGTPRHANDEEFKLSPEYIEGYEKIVYSKLLDGIISAKMTELGLPPEALKDFVLKVKEKIGDRYLTNFNLDLNNSLFGWLTGVSGGSGMSIIYRAKGDVMNEYKKAGTNLQTSLDIVINESGATIGDVIEDTSKDEILEDLNEADLSPQAQSEIQEQIDEVYDGDRVEGLLPDVGPEIELIDEITSSMELEVDENVRLKNIKNSIKKGEFDPVLEIIAGIFNVDPERIKNNTNLNNKQRVPASEVIFDMATNPDGSFNEKVISFILSEGTDASGKSTGISPNLLEAFFEEGPRTQMGDKKISEKETKIEPLKRTGSAAGNITWKLKDNITLEYFLDVFGMNIDGTKKKLSQKERQKADALITGYINEIVGLVINQSLKRNAIKNGIAESIIRKNLDEGKSSQSFSERVDLQNLSQQVRLSQSKIIEGNITNKDLKVKIKLKRGLEYEYFSTKSKKWKKIKVFDFNEKINGKKITERVRAIFPTLIKIAGPEVYHIYKRSTTNGWRNSFFGNVGNFHKVLGIDPNNFKGFEPEAKIELHGENRMLSQDIKLENGKIVFYIKGKKLPFEKIVERQNADRDLLIKILNILKGAGPENAFMYERFLLDASSNTNHIIRTSAYIVGFPINNNNQLEYNVPTEIEHMFQQALMGKLHAILDNPKDFKKVFTKIFGQINLRLDDNTKIEDAGFKNTSPKKVIDIVIPRILNGELDWLPNGLGNITRYTESGIDLNNYMHGEGGSLADVFGVGFDSFPELRDANREQVVKLQNFYIEQIMYEGMTLAKAKSEFAKAVELSKVTKKSIDQIRVNNAIQESFSNRIKNSTDNITNGASIFDFDDTVGKTKSHINATIPNSDGEPKPKRKVIFLAGSAGSGKSNVIKQLGLEDQGFKIVNQDISLEWLVKNSGLPTDMNDFTSEQLSKWGSLQWEARDIAKRKSIKFRGNGDGVIIDGTGASTVSLFTQMQKYKDAGYDVQMIFVDSSLETALERNKNRKERSLKDFIVERNWKAVQKNKKAFEEEFGGNFSYINTDNLNIGDALPLEFTDKINDFVSGYEKIRLTPEEFANQGETLLEQGAEFDFSEFNRVIDGTPGPLLEKLRKRIEKFGNKDVFILTARPQQSAFAIQQFLKGQGIDLPIENITGLADSSGDAKAQWILDKFAEGYNDIYFADDALQNVEAVKTALDQLDIKSKIVQAFSNRINNLDKEFNKIIERKKGVGAEKEFSMAEARKRGAEPDILRSIKRLFIPPSAEDFKGLLYAFLGKGEQGNADMEFFNENLLQPFAKAIMAWNTFKHNMISDYKALKKNFPNVKLNKKVPGTSFTNDTAIRVYLWDKAGFDIPGISKKLKKQLIKHVNKDGDLKGFAEGLSIISKRKEGYVKPSEDWMVETIMSDLSNITDRVSRKEFLQEWIANKDIIFSEKNLNKIEAVYGNSFRYALDNILYRMENGTNRMVGDDKVVNWFTNWINNSVGAIMFFNMRSSLLQTMSTVNFINWSDNNLFEASKAFANQKQFWKDFVMLFNSPMLKQRRKGIKIDVSASELTKSFSEGGATPGNVLNHLLRLGFTPTQIADSFAIAFGGASFFRNRYNKYIKEGKSKKEAEEQAMLDFQEIAEETQQSSREDLISQQQASVLGRIVLAFQNVTMQYTRQTKKAMSDMVNGRGDFKTNMSKIVYYGMVQNVLFSALQTALLFYLFSGEEDENMEDRVFTVFNNSLDSFMRGTGVYGAMGSTIKNTYFEWQKQEDLPAWKQDNWKIAEQVINLSPPIGSKVRKIIQAWKTKQYNEDLSDELSWRIENPTLAMSASLIEAIFNVPTRRLLDKANNLEEAITGNHETWKRVMLTMGWNMWSLGIEDEEVVAAEQENLKQKKEEKQKEKEEKERKEKEEKEAKGIKTVQCSGVNSEGERCKNTIETDKKTWKCVHHAEFKEGSDTDGDGKKEYRCTAIKSDGNRCKNKTENKSKRCYAHPKAEILE